MPLAARRHEDTPYRRLGRAVRPPRRFRHRSRARSSQHDACEREGREGPPTTARARRIFRQRHERTEPAHARSSEGRRERPAIDRSRRGHRRALPADAAKRSLSSGTATRIGPAPQSGQGSARRIGRCCGHHPTRPRRELVWTQIAPAFALGELAIRQGARSLRPTVRIDSPRQEGSADKGSEPLVVGTELSAGRARLNRAIARPFPHPTTECRLDYCQRASGRPSTAS